MEDMIRMLLDVVRTQHSATEGTDEKPFDMDDVVDMAMNIMGRPEGEEAMQDMVSTISQMVESMAPDIFPPKTFEQMDDSERYASAANMIEASLMRGPRRSETRQTSAADTAYSMNPDDYTYGNGLSSEDEEEDSFDSKQAADLNDVIYNNFMQMMGLNEPKLEYPFDRSQIRYGREKSITEQLAEEEEAKKREESARPLSAWELAQNAIDEDDAIHAKEPYIPQVVEAPKSKSASQLAAEAIKRAEEQDRMQMEIERQAARMMEEAKRRGKDPMAFALHQQEILQYMEKNSDELVSFEDYEDLSPEEKYELERQFYIDKQLEEGVAPDQVDREVPEEFIPIEIAERKAEQMRKMEEIAALTGSSPIVGSAPSGSDQVSAAQNVRPVFSEEMLRALSQEVLRENSDMILAENADEDLESLNELLFANIQKMMAGSGTEVEQDNVDDLINQVIASNRESQLGPAQSGSPVMETAKTESAAGSMMDSLAKAMSGMGGGGSEGAGNENPGPGLSAVELARAAQLAAKPEPKVVVEKKSAADLAREAQQEAERAKAALAAKMAGKTLDDEQADIVSTEDSAAESMASGGNISKGMVSEAKASTGNASDSKGDDGLDEFDIPEVDQAAIEAARKREALDREMAMLESKLKANVELTEEDAIAALKASLAMGVQDSDDLDLSSMNLDDLGLDEDLFVEEDAPAVSAKADRLDLDMDDQFDDDQKTGKTGGRGNSAQATESVDAAHADKTENVMAEIEDDLAIGIGDLDTGIEMADSDVPSVEKDVEYADSDTSSVEEDIEYVDPDALVLGEHTQAEIDEALDNLMTLGLEGEVFERAKRMLLLELAGSEEELDAWLQEEENKKKRAAIHDIQDEELDDLSDLDDLDLEQELENAIAEDFGDKPVLAADGENDDAEEGEESQNIYGTHDQEICSDDHGSESEAADGSQEEEDRETAEALETLEEASVADRESPEAGEYITESGGEGDSFGQEVREVEEEEPAFKKAESKKKVKRAQKGPQKSEAGPEKTEARPGEYGITVRKPFSFKSSSAYMDKFEEYIVDTQENRKLTTGFKKLDAMLRYGLHKGSYFIDSEPQYLKNRFMQQMADRAAESGVDVLYISTELSRYDLMLDTISRLSYEMNGKNPEKAVSVMDIMTGEDGADIASLKDELNWYRGRISEHLFLIDQEAVDEFVDSMEETNPGIILEEMIRSIVREGSHKPVVFIDNLENILYDGSYESMRILMEGVRKLAKELGIPILMSYGYMQVESEVQLYPEEKEFHEYLGNLCDVYLELRYADMITDDSRALSAEDIRDMMEDGETLLMDVLVHRNRRPMKASCQIQGTPKYNYFEE